MPKITLPNVDDFTEEDRKHAVKNEDGTFTIDLRPTAVITEFRSRNISQGESLDKVRAKIKKITDTLGVEIDNIDELDEESLATTLTEMKDVQKQVKDGKLVADTSLEEAINQRTTELKSDYERQIKELSKVNNELKNDKAKAFSELDDYILTTEITTGVLDPRSGIRPEALPDVLSRAKSQAKIDGNKRLVFLDGEKKVRYGADAEAPLTRDEWLRETIERAPHFSKTSGGGDADNTTRHGVESLANSGDSESYVAARMKQLNGN